MLTIGILGAAGIAPKAIIVPALRRQDVRIQAIASRSEERAARFAGEHAIPVSYGSYRRLLDDPTIDLVYNALPPSEHAEWSIAALEAGKNVLCEKPFAMNSAQATLMSEAALRTGRRLIEAFHDRYHPLTGYLLQLVASGVLGRLTHIDATFSAHNPFDPASIRHDPAIGGGALMDLGCYPAHWLRSVSGEEPVVLSAEGEANPLGADESIRAELRFPSGATGRLTASMAPIQRLTDSLRIEAENGSVEADGMVFPHNGHSVRELIDGIPRKLTVAGNETYDHQLAAVVRAFETGEPLPTEGHDPLGNMAVIDAIYAQAGFDREWLNDTRKAPTP
jgi:predicted dehydrogenase